MKGFRSSSYGDAFADVYDEWYSAVSDIDSTIALLRSLGGDGPYLELGIGTGRIALALVASGARVTGIDSSPAMLDKIREKIAALPDAIPIDLIEGDMSADSPPGPFAVIFAAYNTFFSLGSAEAQQRVFDEMALRLSPGGSLVIEAAVPDVDRPAGSTIDLRTLEVDRVVLSVDVHHPEMHVVEGQFIEFSEDSGVRLRPWRIRYCTTDELDAMATRAGLELVDRWEDMNRRPFATDSAGHVSVYGLSHRGRDTSINSRISPK